MGGEMRPTGGPQTVHLSTTFLAMFPFPVEQSAPWPWGPLWWVVPWTPWPGSFIYMLKGLGCPDFLVGLGFYSRGKIK